MLKIKENVNLKELEKFGFKAIQYGNWVCYKYEDDYQNIIIGQDRIIHYNHFTVCNELAGVVYDLIKADLIEKVDD